MVPGRTFAAGLPGRCHPSEAWRLVRHVAILRCAKRRIVVCVGLHGNILRERMSVRLLCRCPKCLVAITTASCGHETVERSEAKRAGRVGPVSPPHGGSKTPSASPRELALTTPGECFCSDTKRNDIDMASAMLVLLVSVYKVHKYSGPS